MHSRIFVFSDKIDNIIYYDPVEVYTYLEHHVDYVSDSDLEDDVNWFNTLYKTSSISKKIEDRNFYEYNIRNLFDNVLDVEYKIVLADFRKIISLDTSNKFNFIKDFMDSILGYTFYSGFYFLSPEFGIMNAFYFIEILKSFMEHDFEHIYIYQTFDYHI